MKNRGVKNLILVITSLIVIFTLLRLFIFSSEPTKINDDENETAFNKDTNIENPNIKYYRNFAVKIPDNIDFAGEKVPIRRYHVRESLDLELLKNTYWHSNTILMFKRAYRYFPVIEPILKKNKIPSDFKYLPLIESAFTNATSPKGAKGFWQFMENTATGFDLEVNSEIDERLNLEKSTVAACKYLKRAYRKYDSWTLAAASYNAGEGRISSELKKQRTNNYYDLYLVEETSRYIFRILALKTIFNHPVTYGFYLRKKDFYPPIPTYTVKVDSSVDDLVSFAKKYNITYKILKDFNPWLRKQQLSNKNKKTYYFQIPKEGYIEYDTLLKHDELDTTKSDDSVR